MIEHFEPPQPLQSEDHREFQWTAALGAGLIPGVILLITPRGSPWSSLTFFNPTVLGRAAPTETGVSLEGSILLHLLVSLLYGLIIARLVTQFTQLRAVVAGGVIGLLLYLVNFGAVFWLAPDFLGSEVSVVFTHAVFGLIAGGAYRGLLRRTPAGDTADL